MAAQHEALTDAGRDRIIGLQGQLWTETVKGPDIDVLLPAAQNAGVV